jgi:serine/threonine protein phosphatase PrpC
LSRQEEDIQAKKEECRHIIATVRKQIMDLEHTASKPEDTTHQRASLDKRLKQVLDEYGQTQEKLEASRVQQKAERAPVDLPDRPPVVPRRTEVHETRLGRLVASVGVATWQGNKEFQEDRYILDIELEAADQQRAIGFCVLDGHSGSLCCDALVEWLPRNLQKCLSSKPSMTEANLRAAVVDACALTDEEFLTKAREREVLDGTTMILSLIFQEGARYRMLIANVGDSRAVMCKSQGSSLSALRLSDDHKPAREDERKRIEEKGGVVDVQGVWRVFTPGPANFGGRSVLWGLAVSRAFGDLLMKEPARYGCVGCTGELVSAVPEIHTYELHPAEDRFLILACDGVWDVLEDADAVSVCSEYRSSDQAAFALVKQSFQIGSDDNITALVVAWQLGDEDNLGGSGTHATPKKARVV